MSSINNYTWNLNNNIVDITSLKKKCNIEVFILLKFTTNIEHLFRLNINQLKFYISILIVAYSIVSHAASETAPNKSFSPTLSE